MPLPGGPADKIGNRYEQWWTISQFVRILDEEAESIHIEDPTTEKTEFVITTGDGHEFHQTKRSHSSGRWSLSSIQSLLQTMFVQLSERSNTRFVFVSSSDAPELRELTERAVSARNSEEYESEFVHSKSQKEPLKELKGFWNNADTATAYEMLKCIEVHTIDEKGIKREVRNSLSARFLTEPDKVCDTLLSFAGESIHEEINREKLLSYLKGKGFYLRQLTKPDDAPTLISKATDRYLRARRRLIQDILIPRTSTQQLLDKIKENDTNGADCVLTGKAGGGKTGCVIECVEALQKSDDVAVLTFRLDSIKPVSSTKELGGCLDLEESPALVLKTAAETMSRDAVLIIDQLDAVSTSSGRSADFFEVVEDLLDEVQGLRNSVKIHIVVVCRKFDWENDHRLRGPLGKDFVEVSVIDFSIDEVKSVLQGGGFKPELFETRQLELLRIPQNLSLFLDTNYGFDLQPPFFSQKELFDQYWRKKRQAVNLRATPSPDYWNDIIQVLCDEMTASRQLSVLIEKLDQYPLDYVEHMASENVISFDGKHCGFGHETFFDYCFARGFVANDESLTAFLKKSEQHLFRRAQVRQVLIYLRDAVPERYCKELRALVTDEKIRYHLKDLAVAVAVNMPNPEEAEWKVLAPWIESELEEIESGTPNTDKFASLVWNHFFYSQPWFQIADTKGLIGDWLTSENDKLVDMGVKYVEMHQIYSGDRVAELLEPFVGKGDDWSQRFQSVMLWADFGSSRRFFDMFLKLIDDGTLDGIPGSTDNNRTFVDLWPGLMKAPLDWIPEVIEHWLLRRLSIIQEIYEHGDSPNWRNLFNHDDSGSKYIYDSANQFPDKFVQHVLPIILKIADAAVLPGQQVLPKPDAVWRIFWFNRKYASIDEVCREAVALALEKGAANKPDRIVKILEELQSRETYMANFLLLRAYTASTKHFADDAISELCDKTWRFECGYSDSPYWIAIQLIAAVVPLCSKENRVKLEKAILDYTPYYESIPGGYEYRGRASFALLSGIPVELRSERAQTRYAELELKFGKTDFAPRGIQVDLVVSPIEETEAKKMTDEEWLREIKRYDSDEILSDPENLEKGRALELARMLQKFVNKEPERFARLSLKFPADTHPFYLEHTLCGLKETNGFTELKLEVCRKAYSESRDKYGKAITDLLGSIRDQLPDDAVQMLNWLATGHSDPEKELWIEDVTGGTPDYREDILNHGINTTRGRAAEAIRDLIRWDASYIDRFRTTIEWLVRDKSLSVRACAASILLYITNHDWEFAFEQFAKLIEPQDDQTDSDCLLTNPYVDHFISHGLRDHFGRFQDVIERMLRSELSEISEVGARLASLAMLYQHTDAEALVEEALCGNASQRLGVAQVASANIGYNDCRPWAEQKLLLFFNDPDSTVRGETVECFHRLQEQSLESYENLINEFCDSAAYRQGLSYMLSVLEKSLHCLPSITYDICKKFLECFSDKTGGIRTSGSSSIAKLILRTYHQHQSDDEWAPKCLDLIDQMCLERIYELGKGLEEYER